MLVIYGERRTKEARVGVILLPHNQRIIYIDNRIALENWATGQLKTHVIFSPAHQIIQCSASGKKH